MDKITDLSQTIELMLSDDYEDRFIAEYAQLKIRALRLNNVLSRIADNSAPDCFEPTCDIDTLRKQFYIMIDYLSVLNERALIEDIDLPEVEI